MLRKLKQQVSQAVNAVNAGEGRHEILVNEEDSTSEGFLCPVCMRTFTSPDQLQVHFSGHSTPSPQSLKRQPSESSPSSSFSLPNDVENGYTRSLVAEVELKELKLALEDEKRYSTELKKELDRLHAAVANHGHLSEGEVPYLMQQVQVLEAGKSIATQRILEVEKELSAVGRSNETLKREKGEIVGKLGEMASKITMMTDEIEERQSEKTVLGDELVRYREEMRRLEAKVQNLEKQLDQRPSEDDVNVLRLELVHAQQLMDKITLEKEEEISNHLSSIRSLNMERQQSAFVVQNLEEHNLRTAETVSGLEAVIDALKKQADEAKVDAENALSVAEKEKSAMATKLSVAEEKIAQMEKILEESRRDIDNSHELNETNVRRLAELQVKLDQMGAEKVRYEEDMRRLEEERERDVHEHSEALEKISTLQKSASSQKDELIEELAVVKDALEKEKKLTVEKKMLLDSKMEALGSAESEIGRLKAELADERRSLAEMNAAVEDLKERLTVADANSLALVQKVAEGEDGSKLVMEQMQEEKRKCAEMIEKLENKTKIMKEELLKSRDDLEKECMGKLSLTCEKNRKLEEELEKIRKKYALAEDENKRKSTRFTEMEKDYEEEIGGLQQELANKCTALDEVRIECANLSRTLEESNSLLQEKERIIVNKRDEIGEAVQKLAVMEHKARVLGDELHEAKIAAAKAVEAEAQAKSLADAKEAQIAALASDLQKATSLVDDADEWKTQKEAEAVHLAARIADLEGVVKQGVEQNEELISKLNEVQSAFAESEKNLKSTMQSLQERNAGNCQLSSKVAQLEDLNTAMAATNEEAEQRYDLLNHQLSDAKKEIDRFKTSVAELSDSVISKESLIKELETRIGCLCEESNVMRSDFEKRLISMEEKHSEVEKLYSESLALVTDKEQESMKLTSKVESLEEMLRSKDLEIGDFAERLRMFEEDLNEKRRTIEDLENAKSSLLQKLNTQEEHCAEIAAQSEKKDEEMSDTISTLNEQLAAANADNAKLKGQLQSCEECAIYLKRDFDSQLAEANDLLAKSKEEGALCLESVNVELERTKRDGEGLRESLLAKEEELGKLRAQLDDASSERDRVRLRCEELEKKITGWAEERKALMERCLNSESDLDFERERAAENKRRFDDALSAMHELGRANQSLQMDMSKHFNRKWLDDSEAMNCNFCGKAFSLTLRKHHCRNCGLIFCNSCSSRTAQLPSQKTPVRVCNTCHEDLTNR